MALKYLVIFFSIYCISECIETVPQITYKLEDYELNRWDLLPLNAMFTQPEFNEDTFLVLQGQTVTISVYYNTSTSSGLEYVTYTWTKIATNKSTRYFTCKEGQCSAEFQIAPIYNEMHREWLFWFYKTTGNAHIKNVKFHIRPLIREGAVLQTVTPSTFGVTTYNVPKIHVNGPLLHTQVAVSGIKEFDAFACFVYNGNISFNLTCHYTGGLPLREISITAAGKSHNGSIVKAKVRHTSKITPEKEGAHIDCTTRYSCYANNAMYTDDFTTLRLFLILNGSGSIGNKHFGYAHIKPVSNEDQESCLKYVNCLYDPETKKHSIFCTQSTSNISENDSNKVIIPVAAVVGTVAMLIVLILCIRNNKLCLKRNKNSTLSPVSYINSSNQNQNRQSDSSDHLYVYIDASSLPCPKSIPNSSIKPARPCKRSDNGERSTNYPNENHVVSDIKNNSGEISAEENYYYEIEEAENEYSYAYADRIDILSALQSKT